MKCWLVHCKQWLQTVLFKFFFFCLVCLFIVHKYLFGHVLKTGQTQVSILKSHQLLREVVESPCDSPSRLVDQRALNSACLYLPSVEITSMCHGAWLFYRVLWFTLRSSYLYNTHFTNRVLSPQIVPVCHITMMFHP